MIAGVTEKAFRICHSQNQGVMKNQYFRIIFPSVIITPKRHSEGNMLNWMHVDVVAFKFYLLFDVLKTGQEQFHKWQKS